MARKAVDIAIDKKAIDILMLDIRAVSNIADYFIICSGDSDRQIQAICDDIDAVLGKKGSRRRREGSISSGWVLLDFGEVIVHVLAPQQRQFYELEELWSQATPVVRIL